MSADMYLTTGTLESVAKFVTVLILFVFVLAITYFTTRWIAGFQKAQMHGRNIEVIDTMRISQNKYVQILKIGRRFFAVAVCKDTVTMLGEIPEDEIVIENDDAGPAIDFKQLLEKAKSRNQKK